MSYWVEAVLAKIHIPEKGLNIPIWVPHYPRIRFNHVYIRYGVRILPTGVYTTPGPAQHKAIEHSLHIRDKFIR